MDDHTSKNIMPMPILIPSTLVTVDSHLSTLNNPPPSYTTYPQDDGGRVVSHIWTLHLIPVSNHHHHRLVPRRHPTKTPVCCRHHNVTLRIGTGWDNPRV